jgi:hypothetical protein
MNKKNPCFKIEKTKETLTEKYSNTYILSASQLVWDMLKQRKLKGSEEMKKLDESL